ncbi:MAG: Ig-like domain-containing protein [Proteobacteria bacterium]|nr:Ig-like domain-containing protein [Pseudomonadota bacterium]MBU1717175.1 Ig-like domain-containing protein [Pseudomonadota bacterium]
MKQTVIIAVFLTLLLGGCGGSSRHNDPALPDEDTTPIDNPDSTVPLAIISFYPDPATDEISSANIQRDGIYVVFNEAVDGIQLNSLTATLTEDMAGGHLVAGTINYLPDERKGIFTPDAPLAANYYYTATISGEITDADGNIQKEEYSWQFQINGATPPPPPL